jgi:predicted phage terminase large subunit-like protein
MNPEAARRVSHILAGLKDISPQTLSRAGITLSTITNILHSLPSMSDTEKSRVFLGLEKLVQADMRMRAGTRFMPFVRSVWPGFIEGAHIRQMASAFEDIAEGRKKRLIINMPPRHGKSEMTSYLFPAWFIGRFPHKKLLIATHTAKLAEGYGARIRNLMASPLYQTIFPGTRLAEDTKAKGLWRTNSEGEFFAAGVNSAIAGRGADLFVMDDPYSESDARDGEHNTEVWEKTWQWYQQGPRQRLQPGGSIALVHTRWSMLDMTQRLLSGGTGKEKWHTIIFPAILPSGRQLWPEFWPLEEIESLREEMDPVYWAAQYQQDPTSNVAAIVKRDQWKKLVGEIPEVQFTLTTVDTAHTTDKKNDWSAWTTWGVFRHDIDGRDEDCIILLGAWRDRLQYPELKMAILNHYREYRPDLLRIESKAAGAPLIQELLRMRLPVTEFVPTSKTGNKIRRLRQVSDIFSAGRVFIPADRTWASEVVEEVASFPRGEHDDFVDTVSMALSFLREGNFVSIIDAEPEEEQIEEAPQEYY